MLGFLALHGCPDERQRVACLVGLAARRRRPPTGVEQSARPPGTSPGGTAHDDVHGLTPAEGRDEMRRRWPAHPHGPRCRSTPSRARRGPLVRAPPVVGMAGEAAGRRQARAGARSTASSLLARLLGRHLAGGVARTAVALRGRQVPDPPHSGADGPGRPEPPSSAATRGPAPGPGACSTWNSAVPRGAPHPPAPVVLSRWSAASVRDRERRTTGPRPDGWSRGRPPPGARRRSARCSRARSGVREGRGAVRRRRADPRPARRHPPCPSGPAPRPGPAGSPGGPVRPPSPRAVPPGGEPPFAPTTGTWCRPGPVTGRAGHRSGAPGSTGPPQRTPAGDDRPGGRAAPPPPARGSTGGARSPPCGSDPTSTPRRRPPVETGRTQNRGLRAGIPMRRGKRSGHERTWRRRVNHEPSTTLDVSRSRPSRSSPAASHRSPGPPGGSLTTRCAADPEERGAALGHRGRGAEAAGHDGVVGRSEARGRGRPPRLGPSGPTPVRQGRARRRPARGRCSAAGWRRAGPRRCRASTPRPGPDRARRRRCPGRPPGPAARPAGWPGRRAWATWSSTGPGPSRPRACCAASTSTRSVLIDISSTGCARRPAGPAAPPRPGSGRVPSVVGRSDGRGCRQAAGVGTRRGRGRRRTGGGPRVLSPRGRRPRVGGAPRPRSWCARRPRR